MTGSRSGEIQSSDSKFEVVRLKSCPVLMAIVHDLIRAVSTVRSARPLNRSWEMGCGARASSTRCESEIEACKGRRLFFNTSDYPSCCVPEWHRFGQDFGCKPAAALRLNGGVLPLRTVRGVVGRTSLGTLGREQSECCP
jgi:hypothetical protein